jgi:LPS sulfotransferase NodH
MNARGYVICSYPRSGSNYLCQLLSSTDKLGNPQEWFNGVGIRALLKDAQYPLEPKLQLREVLNRGSTANGVYGLKMFCAAFDRIARLDWTGALPDLHWIHLERRDLLGQAISDVRSTQTRQYRSSSVPLSEPRFDHRAIRHSLFQTACDQARWKVFFARNAIQPLQLVYEDFVLDPQLAVDLVARHVGLQESCQITRDNVTLQIQRDTISEDWRSRFLSVERDTTRLDRVASTTGSMKKAIASGWRLLTS